MQWGRSASRCRRGMKDDRQPMMTLKEDLCILSTEMIWVGDEKGNQPGRA